MKRGVKRTQSATGAIRIISGQWRGRKLPVLDADGLRPTTDRTKETLFNWLMSSIRDSRCLDLFAGSGSLGFEALSRYAASVTFVEKHQAAANQLKDNLTMLKVSSSQATVIADDANIVLPKLTEKFDLVFLDPPFQKHILPGILLALDQSSVLTENALIYIESELDNDNYSVPDNWQCVKERKTKQLSYRLYQFSALGA